MDNIIVTDGDPVLRQKAQEIPQEMFGTKELTDIIYRMSKALRKEKHGVAIAAPQIGISYRIFLIRGFVIQNHERNDLDIDAVFINPSIVKLSQKKETIEGEGCLSVPGVYGTIERHEKAKVRAYRVTGEKFEQGGTDLLAEIFQHEVDHLEGILFIDNALNLRKEDPVPEIPDDDD